MAPTDDAAGGDTGTPDQHDVGCPVEPADIERDLDRVEAALAALDAEDLDEAEALTAELDADSQQ